MQGADKATRSENVPSMPVRDIYWWYHNFLGPAAVYFLAIFLTFCLSAIRTEKSVNSFICVCLHKISSCYMCCSTELKVIYQSFI